MAKYRKKPVVIEAWQAGGDKPMPGWLRAAMDEGTVMDAGHGYVIKTLEGVMLADMGDWIIRGVQGELYPCKPAIFAATYERA